MCYKDRNRQGLMMRLSRRRFLLNLGWASVAGWLARPSEAAPSKLDRPWPRHAFAADQLPQALARLYGVASRPMESNRILLEIPDIAEDGAAVPVTVSSDLPGVERITLLAERNPTPLVAEFLLAPDMEAFVSTRIKLAASGAVLAVVKAGNRYYQTSKTVKVMLGGCG